MTENKVDVKIGEVKAIRGIEPGDKILVDEREATFLGEWRGRAYYMRDDEEPRTRKLFEGKFRECLTYGQIEPL